MLANIAFTLQTLSCLDAPKGVASTKTHIAEFAFIPFAYDTYLPITPSNIWLDDVTRYAKSSLPRIQKLLSSGNQVPFAKFDLAVVRVGIRFADRTEAFIDRNGVVLLGHRCFQLPPKPFKELKAVLKEDWYDKETGIDRAKRGPTLRFNMGG